MTAQRVKYFAYGSNMDTVQMKRRCPSAEVLGSGVLRDRALGFTVYSRGWDGGAADVVYEPGQEVWGIVYVLDIQDLDGLDTDEGYPDQYGRVQLPVEVDGTEHPGVWVYEVVRKLSFVPPKCKYIELMRNAAVRHGFPRRYLESLSAVKCVQ